ncbi:MAG TPA: VacJ family lipoprotein [Steroidobacteraceae bacterium]|nr:VacJ family lipoprotein [Steroidobacteraceae bacterium]
MADPIYRLRPGVIALVVLLLAGCATTSASRSPHDPLEPLNRGVYRFNDALDRTVARPVAKVYHDHVPNPVRSGISNAIDNLAYPTTIVNDLLQGKFRATFTDIGRFLLNSTLGLGGLFDPASKVGLDKNDEDFGQTLGKWGVPSGPYLVLPFFGPSTLRDAPMIYPERYTDLRGYLGDWETKWILIGVGALDTRSELLSVDQVLRNAYDPYLFTRDAYLQRREYQVRDGNVAEEQMEEPMDEPPEEGSSDEVKPRRPSDTTPPAESAPDQPSAQQPESPPGGDQPPN